MTIAGHANARLQGIGGYGVDLFFAISGVLITTRILEEERLRGFFDIRRFYVRRVFRIQPAAMLYLGVIAALMLLGVIHDHWRYWVAATLMYENFVWHPAVLTQTFFEGHFWTLAVEEHFYILLSVLLFLTRRFRMALLVVVWVALYVGEKIAAGHGWFDPQETGRRTYWQLDYLIFAAMAAIVLQRPQVRAWAVRYLKPWVAFASTVGLILLHRWSVHVRHPAMHAYSLDGWLDEMGVVSQFFFTVWVVATMLHPESLTTWLLERAWLRFIGRLSYSLYLWHVLFYFRLEPATAITNPILLTLSGRPEKYLAAFGAALLSYYLVEKPMMRLGHRLAPPARPGRPELMEETVALEA